MLSVDIILYTIITWYFDALLPGDFGTPQPFYFPFTVFFIWILLKWHDWSNYLVLDLNFQPSTVPQAKKIKRPALN